MSAKSVKDAREEYIEFVKEEEGFEGKVYTDATGNLTIGYGHKLTPKEIASKNFMDGIDKTEAARILEEDIFGEKGHYTIARQQFTNLFGEYDKDLGYSLDYDPWNTLSEEQKMMVTDYSFNVVGGVSSYENLMTGILDQDWETINKEYKRRINGKELGRNEAFYHKYIAPNMDPNSSEGTFERILNY